ncbi:uncharacterized protein LOC142582477 [Dermacentor variabilis]|uniref:uncharacterized protein LOC142582477 n=1 Tax=Dermacentor variabilis TaxID=34621 RepID=UPI003F5AF3A2
MLSMISFYSCGELIVKFCLKDGLKPLRKRLKRNAVPSQKIPMRSHEASVRPRVPRRKPPTDSQGNEGQQDDVSEVVINEDCACELPDNLEESEYNDPPVQDWLPPPFKLLLTNNSRTRRCKGTC